MTDFTPDKIEDIEYGLAKPFPAAGGRSYVSALGLGPRVEVGGVTDAVTVEIYLS